MSAAQQQLLITADEYLHDELTREVKHELINGSIYAMAGASANHERIAGNVSRKFGNHLENSSCEVFSSDMKVKVGENFFYPDVLVDCHFDNNQAYFTDTPLIIVEVLSKSTRRTDEKTKFLAYMNMDSVQEYVLIEQDYVDITHFRRKNSWLPEHYFLGEEITFESIALTLTVEEIYHRVNNEDMLELAQTKNG